MINNDVLKNIAIKTKGLKYLASKDKLSHEEYILLVFTDEWQKEFIDCLNYLKSIDKDNWY